MSAIKPVMKVAEKEVQGWIKSGLRDFSISRASVDWGIPVPDDKTQTIYVWFDALLGYISALSDDQEQPDLLNAVSSGWPASLHLIGKDILRFHAVYWPAMLMSAGLSLPKMVFGHGFLTKDGMKMGKSLGNTLEPNDLVNKFGTDAVRYFFLREVEFGNDGDYSEERFINIVNAHLANTIGNLLNRTLGLLKKNCQSTLVVDSTTAAEGNAFKDNVERLVDKARVHYENLSLSSACEAVLEIGNVGNSYMDERAPWSLFKQGGFVAIEDKQMPKQDFSLMLEQDLSDTKWGGLKGGQVMAQPKPVFARIENQTEVEDKGVAVGKNVKGKGKLKQAQQVAGA
ncbi:Rossmann-like alpha/beta/alpha sandwich fold [Sesbania bispinosa]|nr:Rossmann-like alpha/beta/alpha sandwich fold [Sesbania bispinosa]